MAKISSFLRGSGVDRSEGKTVGVSCNICGSSGQFADPTNGANLRESLVCQDCRATSRDRMLMYLMGWALGFSFPVRSWGANPNFRVFETAGYRGYPQFLSAKFDYYNTKYDPEKIAARADPRSYADVQNLPYAEAFFDCVLSSDVFEHVRLDDKGFREVFRVLKPGGIFLLQVPYRRAPETHVLVRPEGDKDVFLEPAQYHAEQTLVYRIYGYDLLDRLNGYGFSVSEFRMAIPAYAISMQPIMVMRKGSFTQFTWLSD